MKPVVLVTGAAGRVARIIRPVLARDYALRLLDKAPLSGEPDAFAGDINDAVLLDRAMAGVDAVIHLAADARVRSDFESVLSLNLQGAHSVFEAARRHAVRRVVFASSNRVVEGYNPLLPQPAGRIRALPAAYPLSVDAPPRPDGFYGVSKVFGESLAQYYADHHGVSAVCLRLGSVTSAPEGPYLATPRAWALWMSPRDLAELFRCAVAAQFTGCITVYGCSTNTRRWWDLSTQQLIHFRSQDDSEAMLAEWVRDAPVPPPPAYPLPWGERLGALPAAHDWLVWLGQSGFFLKTRGGVQCAVDPFLSEWSDRMQPPLLPAVDLPADLLLITHTHRDHLDVHALPLIARARPQARFVTPPSGLERLLALGIGAERIIVVRPGESHAAGDLLVTAIAARHQESAPDAQGYALRLPAITLYHTGDSEYDPCLLGAAVHAPQVLLAPINGRGGNMTAEQAARLAGELAVSAVVPMHYGCLRKPGEEPDVLLNAFRLALPLAAPGVLAAEMQPGSIARLPFPTRR